MQGCPLGSMIGVPARSPSLSGILKIACGGHTSIHASHRVHPATNSDSGTAWGGRWMNCPPRFACPSGFSIAKAGSLLIFSTPRLRIALNQSPRSKPLRDMLFSLSLIQFALHKHEVNGKKHSPKNVHHRLN